MLGLDMNKRRDLCDALIKAKQFKYIPIANHFWEYDFEDDYLVHPTDNFQRLQYGSSEIGEPIELEEINVRVGHHYHTVKAVECVRTNLKNWYVTRGEPTEANSVFLVEREFVNGKLEVTALIEHNARLLYPFNWTLQHQQGIKSYFADQITRSNDFYIIKSSCTPTH